MNYLCHVIQNALLFVQAAEVCSVLFYYILLKPHNANAMLYAYLYSIKTLLLSQHVLIIFYLIFLLKQKEMEKETVK